MFHPRQAYADLESIYEWVTKAEPAAAVGVRLRARRARGDTTLTLFGGFASTVCWPLSAFLVEATGWRGACNAYAALHLALARCPLTLLCCLNLPPPELRITREGKLRKHCRP